MNRKVRAVIITSWLFVMTIARVLFYLFSYNGIITDNGYYSSLLLRDELREYTFSSGLSFGYVNFMYKLVHNLNFNMTYIFVIQLVLEILALLFLVLGAIRFWNFNVAMVVCTIFGAFPALFECIRICSPEEFFLFFFSLEFFVLSVFRKYTRAHNFTRSTINEVAVLLVGILSGVIICWNYMGILLIVLMLIIMVWNYRILNDKGRLQYMIEGEELEEEDQIMSVFEQLSLLGVGLFLGMTFTLLKYTGYSGLYLIDQYKWYFNLYKSLPQKTMDLENSVAVLLIAFVLLGELFMRLFIIKKRKKENERLAQGIENFWGFETENAFVDRGLRAKGEASEYFITEDGRKVHYLENPLPGPKKKEQKDLRFDLDELLKKSEKLVKKEEVNSKEDKAPNKVINSINKNYINEINNPIMFSLRNNFDFDTDIDDDDDFDV